MESSLIYRPVLPSTFFSISVADIDTSPERQASQTTTYCALLSPADLSVVGKIVRRS